MANLKTVINYHSKIFRIT